MSTFKVLGAFDQRELCELTYTTASQTETALARASEIYQDRTLWLGLPERISILERLADLVEQELEFLALGATREGGKPLLDSRVEMQRALSGIKQAAAVLPLVGQEVPMGQNAASAGRMAFTYREPRGVVLAISAFNHPFNLLIHQVVTAIAAGCPVVIKPSLKTPLSCQRLIDLLSRAGLPEGYAQMLLMPNERVGPLVSDSRISFLSYVGSSKVGWHLRSRLAAGATCMLEHGGVAPVIIDESADLSRAVPLLLKGGFYHAGQVCVSVQRVFVEKSRARQFAESLAEGARQLVVGDPTQKETQVGPLIQPAEVERVHAWVQEAQDKGAELVCGGQPLSETTYAPTVLLNPSDDCQLSQQEVFGPVVCVYEYEDLDVAIERANLEDYYFQAALFTNRLDRALEIGRRLHGMAVMVNDHTAFRVDWMPFGGHRHSGVGVGGIEQTIEEMTIERMLVFRS